MVAARAYVVPARGGLFLPFRNLAPFDPPDKEDKRTMPSDTYVEALRARNYILSQLPQNFPQLEVAIICGSGLSGLVSTFHADPQISIPYPDIPNFPVSTVEGHANSLVFGTLGEKRTGVVAMIGRFHFYEGYDMAQVTFPIRVFHLLKVRSLIGLILPSIRRLTSSYECRRRTE